MHSHLTSCVDEARAAAIAQALLLPLCCLRCCRCAAVTTVGVACAAQFIHVQHSGSNFNTDNTAKATDVINYVHTAPFAVSEHGVGCLARLARYALTKRRAAWRFCLALLPGTAAAACCCAVEIIGHCVPAIMLLPQLLPLSTSFASRPVAARARAIQRSISCGYFRVALSTRPPRSLSSKACNTLRAPLKSLGREWKECRYLGTACLPEKAPQPSKRSPKAELPNRGDVHLQKIVPSQKRVG